MPHTPAGCIFTLSLTSKAKMLACCWRVILQGTVAAAYAKRVCISICLCLHSSLGLSFYMCVFVSLLIIELGGVGAEPKNRACCVRGATARWDGRGPMSLALSNGQHKKQLGDLTF
jgi:hypothetical protein